MIFYLISGKSSGHDLDLLLTYPEHEGEEMKLITVILGELEKKNLVLWSQISRIKDRKSYDDLDLNRPLGEDHLHVCMIILKFPLDEDLVTFKPESMHTENQLMYFIVWIIDLNKVIFVEIGSDTKNLLELSNSQRNWRAVRIDLVPAMPSKFPFALLGWTGSKQYNRSLRLHAKKLGYSLSSTRLYDIKQVFTIVYFYSCNIRLCLTSNCCKQGRAISAKSEKDIFDYLKISYRKPEERNFWYKSAKLEI